jgi:hypothetical protein
MASAIYLSLMMRNDLKALSPSAMSSAILSEVGRNSENILPEVGNLRED